MGREAVVRRGKGVAEGLGVRWVLELLTGGSASTLLCEHGWVRG